jgi:D-tyrosyl-tRNA(Tyr) deacylase
MRVLIQRVKSAEVKAVGRTLGAIEKGLLIFVGIKRDDTEKDAEWLANKVVNLRVFDDSNGKMNLSSLDIRAELLVVSQFTLYGDARRGRRPDFTQSALPDRAEKLYILFVEKLKSYALKVETGMFGAKMEVFLCNDGPVTLMLES